ncbi:MAG: hypothetical protein GX754_06520 [Clostridiaceae bacterium]|nr:hypothetical protein [Clostridiaceae bacterium]
MMTIMPMMPILTRYGTDDESERSIAVNDVLTRESQHVHVRIVTWLPGYNGRFNREPGHVKPESFKR